MYEYLVGSLIFGVVWLFFFLSRRDLRRPMLWTAVVYILFSFVMVSLWYFLRSFVYLGEPIVPSYWYPTTLFNFGKLSGFAGIEDILFLVFIGGIATCIYEFIYKKEIIVKKSYKPHLRAFAVSFVAFFVFVYFWPINLIYALIFSNLTGAAALLIERKDLAVHSIMGGLAFLLTYLAVFILFLAIFPHFISQFYNLKELTGVIVLGIPLEEYLYAFSFGLMWAPMYEYAHGEKDKNKK